MENPIVFIAFNGADNLGIGYMRAMLSKSGFKSIALELREGKKVILKRLKEINPKIVGFSVIFQSHFKTLTELVVYLRNEGINCHFTAGGHYASMRYEELFRKIPLLDSIVRFEGEYTMLDLAKCLYHGTDWRKIDGLVYKIDNKIIINSLSPVETDLDKFPFPTRPVLRQYVFKLKYAALIAGRGCIYNCSFCNSKEYFRQMSGPHKRIRRPEMVVEEMKYLYETRDCSIFMFDDDDFPVMVKKENTWIQKFCNSLKKLGLEKPFMWKINCRVDEIEVENFRLMKKNGLFYVFLGIEDGTANGLKYLNKHTTVADNLNSINILKQLKIGFDFGFMLFQPDTAYESLKENLNFLINICGDGYTPVTFCKLLPLYETQVEKELDRDGRLKIINGTEDYYFKQESMNYYFNFVMGCFSNWINDSKGFVNISKWAINYFAVYFHFFEANSETRKLRKNIQNTISESNMFLLKTLKELITIFENREYLTKFYLLDEYREKIKSEHSRFKDQINNTMGYFMQFVSIESYQMSN